MRKSKVHVRGRNFWVLGCFFSFCLLSFALPAAAAPTLRILEPTPNGFYETSKPTTFQFKTISYLFVNYENNEGLYPLNKEAGHAHVWLDPENENLQHARAWHFYSARPIALGELELGEHEIFVELAANNHSSLRPQVREHVRFFVSDAPIEIIDGIGDVQPWSSFGDAMLFVFLLVAVLAIRSSRASLMRRLVARKKRIADQQKPDAP